MHYMIITYFYSLKIFLGWALLESEYADREERDLIPEH